MQHQGAFLRQRPVRSCSSRGSMVGPSSSLLLQMGCSPLQPHISRLVSHLQPPGRSTSRERRAVPHGSTAGSESWWGGWRARGRATCGISVSAPGPSPESPQAAGKGERGRESSFTPSTRVCAPTTSPPTSRSNPSFLLGKQPLWGADGSLAAPTTWACGMGTPKCRNPTAGQQAGILPRRPARSAAMTRHQSRAGLGSCFPTFAAAGGRPGKPPRALNRVWKHLHSPGWEEAAGHPRGCAGLGRKGAMSGAACVVGTDDLAQPSFLHRC